MTHRQLMRIGALVTIAGTVVAAAYACGSPDHMKPTAPHATADRALQARAPKWIGEIHNAIAADFVSHRREILRGDRTATCQALVAVLARHVPDADAAAGITRSPSDQRHDAYLAITRQVPICSGLVEVTGTGFAPPPPTETDTVTGAFEDYAGSVADAVSSTDGTPGPVANATYSAASAASGIDANDYGLVLAVAGVATSSSNYWYGVASGGGLCDAVCNPSYISAPTRPTSPVYRFAAAPPPIFGALLVIVGADAWGCVAGELSAWHGGHTSQSYLYNECAIWGGGASLGTAMGYMAK